MRLLRIKMAKDTGWPLEYIDSLALADVGDYVAVTDATNRAEAKLRKMKTKQ